MSYFPSVTSPRSPYSPHSPQTPNLPNSFVKKKLAIRNVLNRSTSSYGDKSPKGSVDTEILTLIGEINDCDGYVTTSSCAGRVAVFVEGRKATLHSNGTIETNGNGIENKGAGPGGKGYGNKWLYNAHAPVPERYLKNDFSLSDQYQLQPQSADHRPASTSRLIKLNFSPLILHVLCGSLQDAKKLLAAAINAGFRESGVQSLKALDDDEAGVMLAIRTAGLAFETVIGVVEESDNGDEVYRAMVSEDCLKLCTMVVNERFSWNVERRERLRKEIERMKLAGDQTPEEWEDSEARAARKREEGLRKQQIRGDKPVRHEHADILEEEDLFESIS